MATDPKNTFPQPAQHKPLTSELENAFKDGWQSAKAAYGIKEQPAQQEPVSKEAIRYITATLAAFGPDEAISMTKETWAKLRGAIKTLAEQPAQQALDKMAENARELGLDYEPAQQEPVATVTSEAGNPNVSMSWWHEPALPVGKKLYTSPPAQRTWVGLTDEERQEIWKGCDPTHAGYVTALVEAKLKEKNSD